MPWPDPLDRPAWGWCARETTNPPFEWPGDGLRGGGWPRGTAGSFRFERGRGPIENAREPWTAPRQNCAIRTFMFVRVHLCATPHGKGRSSLRGSQRPGGPCDARGPGGHAHRCVRGHFTPDLVPGKGLCGDGVMARRTRLLMPPRGQRISQGSQPYGRARACPQRWEKRVRDAEVRAPPPVPEVAILRPFRAIWPPRSGWWRFAADPAWEGRQGRPGASEPRPRGRESPGADGLAHRPGTGPAALGALANVGIYRLTCANALASDGST